MRQEALCVLSIVLDCTEAPLGSEGGARSLRQSVSIVY